MFIRRKAYLIRFRAKNKTNHSRFTIAVYYKTINAYSRKYKST